MKVIKILIASILLSATSTLVAQNLSKKISNSASLVLTVNGKELLQKIDVFELDNSRLFKESVHEFFRGHDEILKLDDFGIDYNERIHFVMEYGEDIQFFYMTYKIKNLSSFEKAVKSNGEYEVEAYNKGLKRIAYSYKSQLIWNNDYALLLVSDYMGSEYENNWWYDDYAETAEAVEYAEPDVETSEMTEEDWKEYWKKEEEKRVEREKEQKEKQKEKEKEREERQEKKKTFVKGKMTERINLFFSDELENNNNYAKINYDEEADASLWSSNYLTWFSPFYYFFGHSYSYRYSYLSNLGIFNTLSQGNFTANLYLEEDQIQLDVKLNYPAHLTKSYTNIFSTKLNKKMMNYISSDDLGYYAFSVSTESVLEEYPKILKEMVLTFDTTYADEYDVLLDLFSIVVDEEEIAELLTGDMAFIFNDLSFQEVEYYRYEYDENFNSTEILDTRTELMPDFTGIVGCNNDKFISKLFKLGIKNEIIEAAGTNYKLVDKRNRNPFELYFTYRDNLFFTTTSKKVIAQINLGGVSNRISGNDKKSISKSTGAFYVDIERTIKNSLGGRLSEQETKLLVQIQDDLKKLYANFSHKGGGSNINVRITIPESENNSASYLLHFIDKMIEFEQSNHYQFNTKSDEKIEESIEEESCEGGVEEGSCEGGSEEESCDE